MEAPIIINVTTVIMLISTALLLDSNIRNSVCTPAKLPCRRVVEGNNDLTSVKEKEDYE
jgi:hypothetical protein